MSDIEKLIRVSGDSEGFAAALEEAERQARTAASRFDTIDKQLQERMAERDAAFAQKRQVRTDAVLRRGLDARIKMLDKETDSLIRALNKQQTAVERAEQRVTAVRNAGAKQRERIAQQEAQAQAKHVDSFLGRAAQGAARGLGPPAGFPVPFLGGGVAGIGGGLVGAAVGFGLKKAVDDTLAYTEAMRDLMNVTQQTAEVTSRYAAIAERLGVDHDKLGDALRNMASDIAQNPERWEAMGIAIQDAEGKARPFLDVFDDFRHTFAAATQDSETYRAAQEVLGRSYADLLPLLRATDDQFAALGDQVSGTSRVLTTEGMQANLEYAQSLKTIEIGFQNMVGIIGQLAIPMFAKFIEVMQQTFDAFGTFVHGVLGGQGIGEAYGTAIRDSQARAAAAREAARKIAADSMLVASRTGGAGSLPTTSSLSNARRAAADALRERIDAIRDESTARLEAMRDTLKAFEREREVALRTIQDEQKARQRQHEAELDAINAETEAREDAFRARERARDDELDGLRAELRLLDEVADAEKARRDLADAEADLAMERNIEVFRSASQSGEDYQQAVFNQQRRVRDAEKKVAEARKKTDKDETRARIEERIRAIERERELDRRALEDYKQGAEDRVRVIRATMELEKTAADARLQQIRDEMSAERDRISDLIEQEQRATKLIIDELEKRRAAAVAASSAGTGSATVGGNVGGAPPGGDTGRTDPDQRAGERGGTTTADVQRWFQLYLGRPAEPEEIAGRLGRNRADVETEIRESLEARIYAEWLHRRGERGWGTAGTGAGGGGGGTFDYPHTRTLREPTLLVGLRSGQAIGVAAARGDEDVTFGGVGERRGDTMTVVIPLHINGREIGRAVGEIKTRRASHGYGRNR